MAKRNKTKGPKVVSKERKVRSIEPDEEIREIMEDAGEKALQTPKQERHLTISTQMPLTPLTSEVAVSHRFDALEELAAAIESSGILPLAFEANQSEPPPLPTVQPLLRTIPAPVPTRESVEEIEGPTIVELVPLQPALLQENKEMASKPVEDRPIGAPLMEISCEAEQTPEETTENTTPQTTEKTVMIDQVAETLANIEQADLKLANTEQLEEKSINIERLEGKPLGREQPEEKLLTIKQVAIILQVEMSTIRFWEKEFAEYLGPSMIRNQRKCFSQKQLEIFTKIKELLKTEQYTIDGAKRRLELDHILTSSLGVEHNFKTTVFIMLTAIMQELQVSRQESRELSLQLDKLEQEKHHVEDQLQEEQKKGLLDFIKTKLNKKGVVGREA